jgi:thioredoxin-like negative regulator of GroEL
MVPTVYEQLIVTGILFAGFFTLTKSYVWLKYQRIQKQNILKSLPVHLSSDHPTLLYFWSHACMQCKPQERNIERAKELLRKTGRTFDTLKLNAVEERQLAKLLHVMTVPTTVLLDPRGSVKAWNAGLVNAQKLVDQLESPDILISRN